MKVLIMVWSVGSSCSTVAKSSSRSRSTILPAATVWLSPFMRKSAVVPRASAKRRTTSSGESRDFFRSCHTPCTCGPAHLIPPGATRTSDELTFRYTYDKANNLLTKKVPDADLVTYKYNTRDQPVLLQDGNLATGSKYIASVYDDYGRVTATGYFSGGVPSPISATGLSIKAADELTKSYYDGTDGGDAPLDLTTNPQYRGKVRKSLAKVLDGSSTATWLHTTNSYDAHGRLTATTGNNYQNPSTAAAESVTMTYDWADNLLRQTRVHKPSSSVIRTLAYRNTYGGSGQRAGLYLKVDSGTEQLLASYGYNERDLLAQRNLHGVEVNGDDGHLQSLDYTYNAPRA